LTFKREAPGNCPICPMVNPALPTALLASGMEAAEERNKKRSQPLTLLKPLVHHRLQRKEGTR